MADSFVETESSGFLGNMGKAIMAVPIGILLFFLSFVVFWKTEGRTDWSKIAATSKVVAADSASGNEGEFVSVTGALTSSEKLGDPDFIAPGDFLTIDRRTQMFAWVEHRKSEKKKKVGGKTETVTTYNYEMEWTSNPKMASDFKYPDGHNNPTPSIDSAEFSVNTASVGAWGFNVADAQIPSGDDLPLDGLTLVNKGLKGAKSGNELIIGKSVTLAAGSEKEAAGEGAAPTIGTPQLGDMKVSFRALKGGGTVTMFGKAEGGKLARYMVNDEDTYLRAVEGNRDEALVHLKNEFKAMGWIGRIVGFLMMWIGMTMVFTPLHAFLDVIPFMGSVSRNLLGCVLFPIALVLSAISILISMIFHSVVAMVIIVLLLAGGGFFAWKKKQAQGA